MYRPKPQSGFTLIEVIIAMAIIGLLSLTAFIGATQLARDKRDDARKADAARLLTAARQWVSNNNGSLPGSGYVGATGAIDLASIVSAYITAAGSSFTPPGSSTPWTLAYQTTTPGLPLNSSTLYLGSPAICASNNLSFTNGTIDRKIAVVVYLENGGSYCISQ